MGKKNDYSPAYKNYFSLANSLGKNKDSEKFVVVCRKPSMFAYHGNCRTTRYQYSLDDREVIQHMLDINTDFVVLEQLGYSSTPRYLLPAIQKNQSLFKTVINLKQPDTYLLSFDKKKAKKLLRTLKD